jgi:hypothetical protein
MHLQQPIEAFLAPEILHLADELALLLRSRRAFSTAIPSDPQNMRRLPNEVAIGVLSGPKRIQLLRGGEPHRYGEVADRSDKRAASCLLEG